MICSDCNHIKGIHNPKCKYVNYIEGIGASVCKCTHFAY